MSSQILLYSGEGANPFCTQALKNQIEDLCDNRFHTVSSFTSFGNWSDPRSIKAIFISGGNAAAMWGDSDLMEVNTIVKEVLDKYRISYYGACAGGILASKALFINVPDTITPNGFSLNDFQFLDLFPGKTIAPLFPIPSSRSLSTEDFKIMTIKTKQSRVLNSVHILGPGYLNAQTLANTEVLSTYVTLPNFYLGCLTLRLSTFKKTHTIEPTEISESIYHKRESGACVLVTSSHLEIDSKTILSKSCKDACGFTSSQQEMLAREVKHHDVERKALLKQNFEKIGIICKEEA